MRSFNNLQVEQVSDDKRETLIQSNTKR
jgi:hypothetical protein